MGKYQIFSLQMFNRLTYEIFLFSYPSSMIEKEFQKFFHDYISSSPFTAFLQDANAFYVMRKQMMGQSTPQQSQVANDVANAIFENDEIEELHSIVPTITTTGRTGNRKPIEKNTLVLHYTHEKRFSSTKRDIHKTYGDVFADTPAMDIKILVASRNRRKAANDLIRKKPLKSLLTNKPYKSESFFAAYLIF